MNVVVGAIKAGKFSKSNFEDFLQKGFKKVVSGNENYWVVHTFEKYINSSFDFVFNSLEGYQKWLSQGVDKKIEKVEYNWNSNKALITIVDTNFPGPHEFDCTDVWTISDCEKAIEKKFPG